MLVVVGGPCCCLVPLKWATGGRTWIWRPGRNMGAADIPGVSSQRKKMGAGGQIPHPHISRSHVNISVTWARKKKGAVHQLRRRQNKHGCQFLLRNTGKHSGEQSDGDILCYGSVLGMQRGGREGWGGWRRGRATSYGHLQSARHPHNPFPPFKN